MALSPRPVAVLFTGGPASTLAALRLGERHREVHLVVARHRGALMPDDLDRGVRDLVRFFGDPGRFTRVDRDVDDLRRRLCTHGYLRSFARRGLRVLDHPISDLLAAHGAGLAHCVEHGVQLVCDGLPATPGDPLRAAAVAELEALHAGAGLRYERPVGGDHARAASILEDLGQRRPGAGLPGQIGAAEATLAHAVATLTGFGRSAEAIGAARAAWLRDRMAPLRAWAAATGLQGGGAEAARSA